MSDFDWNDLRTFLAVVRTGRLTVAARQLGVDHSTLSRRIIALEKALHARLFDRQPTGYVLTPAGENLIAEAEAVESLAIRIETRIAEPGVGMAGSVRIATPEGFGTYFVVKHLAKLTALHPAITVELIAHPGAVSLTKREADVAVTMSRPATGPLRARKLLDYELGLYASRSYLADHPRPATLADVAERGRLVGYISDLVPTPSHDYLKDLFGSRQADLCVSNILTQMGATLAGYGYCILPCFMAAAHRDLERILPVDARIVRSYWLVSHAEMRAPARTRATIEFLDATVQTYRRLFLPS